MSAKDLGTGKEQKIEIKSGSGLSDEEIERIISDAGSHNSHDERLRELAEARNNGAFAADNARQQLKPFGDRLTGPEKREFGEVLQAVDRALKGGDAVEIRAVTEHLERVFSSLMRGIELRETGAAAPLVPDAVSSNEPRQDTSGASSKPQATRGRAVFISYRREEASGHAGRLYDAVERHLGPDNVFMDLTIEPGTDFVEAIQEGVGGCRVLLVVIGSRWLSVKDAHGRVRLENPDDFVRLEVSTGLARSDLRVVPVLVHGARMPRADELPDDLARLARRHAVELSDGRWTFDVGKLLDAVDRALAA